MNSSATPSKVLDVPVSALRIVNVEPEFIKVSGDTTTFPCANTVSEVQALVIEYKNTHPKSGIHAAMPREAVYILRDDLYYEVLFPNDAHGRWPLYVYSCKKLHSIQQGSLHVSGMQNIALVKDIPQDSTRAYFLIDTLLSSFVIKNGLYA